MQYLPEWFPGAKFLREAKEWRPAVETMSKVPFDDVKAQLVSTPRLNANAGTATHRMHLS